MNPATVRLKEPGWLWGAASQPSGSKLPRHSKLPLHSKLPRHRVDVFVMEMPEHYEAQQNFHHRYHFSTQAHGLPSS